MIPAKKNGESPMKISMLLTLIVVVGCVLATGCIAQTKKDVNNTTINTTNTFTPFVNATMNITNNTNVTNATNVTALKGPLRVSISGYPAALAVILDNQTVGNVSREKPLDLMVNEGSHSVKVCVVSICEVENVSIIFAKKSFIDFGDRLRKDVEFPLPTVRMVEYYKSGSTVSVILEFINPSENDLSMSAEASVGYSYIESRSGTRKGDSARGKAMESVRAGQRISHRMDLYFVDGDAYNFDEPTISNIQYKSITL
jgi:outer membrane murein-binding lipoprotein Lpp